MKKAILLTCEHASNHIDAGFKRLGIPPLVLASHRGYDPGAAEVCRFIELNLQSQKSKLPYKTLYGTTSRLLIDLNRSLKNRGLFSEFSRRLGEKEKQELLENYYLPYRNAAKDFVGDMNAQKAGVIHFSIHSFTPQLNGKIRNASIGILYDPARPREVQTARGLKSHLQQARLEEKLPDECERLFELPVRMNYPYKGTSDGLTRFLRSVAEENLYTGLEIEVNQKYMEAEHAALKWLAHSIANYFVKISSTDFS